MKVKTMIEILNFHNKLHPESSIIYDEYGKVVNLVSVKKDKNGNIFLCSDSRLGNEFEPITTQDFEFMLSCFDPEATILYEEYDHEVIPFMTSTTYENKLYISCFKGEEYNDCVEY